MHCFCTRRSINLLLLSASTANFLFTWNFATKTPTGSWFVSNYEVENKDKLSLFRNIQTQEYHYLIFQCLVHPTARCLTYIGSFRAVNALLSTMRCRWRKLCNNFCKPIKCRDIFSADSGTCLLDFWRNKIYSLIKNNLDFFNFMNQLKVKFE